LLAAEVLRLAPTFELVVDRLDRLWLDELELLPRLAVPLLAELDILLAPWALLRLLVLDELVRDWLVFFVDFFLANELRSTDDSAATGRRRYLGQPFGCYPNPRPEKPRSLSALAGHRKGKTSRSQMRNPPIAPGIERPATL
jgi:hypothetical protein